MLRSGYSTKTASSKKELLFQKQLILSATAQGGYGRKTSHMQLKGVLDLIIQLPGFSLAHVECKDLGERKEKFSAELGITEHQKATAEKLNEAAGALVAFYAFRVKYPLEEVAYLSSRYSDTFQGMCGPMVKVYKNPSGWVGLRDAWEELGVARLDLRQGSIGAW